MLVAILVITAILAPGGPDTAGRELSTRSRAIDGAHGLRAVLDALGWHTRERLTPYAGTLDTAATYVMLGTPLDPSAHEIHTLLNTVRHGANAIVVPERGSAIAESIGVQTARRTFIPLRPTSDSLFGSADRVDSVREAFGELSARTFHTYLEGTPPSDSDSVGAWPASARTLLSVGKRDIKPEIAVLPMGRGQVVAIADPAFLRNDVLRKTAGAVLAVRILENVDPARRSPIVFDEYHQGYGEQT